MSNTHNQRVTLMEAVELASSVLNVKLTYHQIWRSARQGTRSRDGRRIYLQCERYGGKLYTSLEWLREYAAKVAQADKEYFTKQAEIKDTIEVNQQAKKTKTKPPHGNRQRQYMKAESACKNAGF